MTDVFFFGRLRHAPLRALVLGPEAAAGQGAQVQGWQAVQAEPRAPAGVIPAAAQKVDGVVIDGMSPAALTRLRYYARAWQMQEITLSCGGRALLAFTGQVQADAPIFDAAVWAATWGEMACYAAEELMSYQASRPAADFGAHRLKIIDTRAAALVRAPGRARPSDWDLDQDVQVIARHRPYHNFFNLEEIDLRHRRFDGTMAAEMNRAALRVGDAAIVLPYDPVRDCVLLVEQFRAAPYIAGDQAPWIWEAPAGLVDPGETPEQAAHREAQEEAHVTLRRLEPVTQAYSSTGSSTEFSHIFVGIADLSDAGIIAGLAAEGEDIRSEVIAFDRLMADYEAGRFVNLHLVTATLWLALNRDRLRQAG